MIPQASDEVVQRFLEPGRRQHGGLGMAGNGGWAHMAEMSVYYCLGTGYLSSFRGAFGGLEARDSMFEKSRVAEGS